MAAAAAPRALRQPLSTVIFFPWGHVVLRANSRRLRELTECFTCRCPIRPDGLKRVPPTMSYAQTSNSRGFRNQVVRSRRNSATITNPRHRKRISLGEAAASRLSNRVSFPLRRTANAIAKRSNSVKSGTQSAKFVMTAMILRTDRYGRLNF